jgi:CheY-like chemotaxis protein
MCHVLIIEDEPLIALAIQGVVEDNGATSTDIVDTQDQAVISAARRRPGVITSDHTLRSGTGPAAVAAIRGASGPIPVIYIAAMPHQCPPPGPDVRVFGKPMNHEAVGEAFREFCPA